MKTNGESNAKKSDDKELHVLFLGNSLIYYNDLPATFSRIAGAAGKKVFVDSVTKGSATMTKFGTLSTEIGRLAHDKLSAMHWDYVVIEPSRRITPYETTVRDAEFGAARLLTADATAAGGKILLYGVFGNNNGQMKIFRMIDDVSAKSTESCPISRADHTRYMYGINRELAAYLGGAKTVDAGVAFENQIAADPAVNLYDADNRHPNKAGTYLVACMFYAAVYGERTVPIHYSDGLDEALAAALRETADKTAFDRLNFL